MSICSSDGTPQRKNSWLITKIDKNEVDAEVEEWMEEWRRSNGEEGHVACVQAALDYCRGQLKELLEGEETQTHDGKTRPSELDGSRHEHSLQKFTRKQSEKL